MVHCGGPQFGFVCALKNPSNSCPQVYDLNDLLVLWHVQSRALGSVAPSIRDISIPRSRESI